MNQRTSIEIQGYNHGGAPIPAASRVGGLVVTGGVHGMDPATGAIPDAVEDQARLMFANLGRILEAAGCSFAHIARMTVYIKVPQARAAVNTCWLETFPDPASRPARHVLQYDHLSGNMLVQCDAIAFVSD